VGRVNVLFVFAAGQPSTSSSIMNKEVNPMNCQGAFKEASAGSHTRRVRRGRADLHDARHRSLRHAVGLIVVCA
jgi:hypothetical protein